MIYNGQIVLEILRSEFGKEIKEFVSRQVMDLNSDELEFLLDMSASYAIFSGINKMEVYNYRVEKKTGKSKGDYIHGTVVILAEIHAFADWNGEEQYVDSTEVEFGAFFAFDEKNEQFYNLRLEYWY